MWLTIGTEVPNFHLFLGRILFYSLQKFLRDAEILFPATKVTIVAHERVFGTFVLKIPVMLVTYLVTV
jgi:hypothetical protein